MWNCRPDGEFLFVARCLFTTETLCSTRGYECGIAECEGLFVVPCRCDLAVDPMASLRPVLAKKLVCVCGRDHLGFTA